MEDYGRDPQERLRDYLAKQKRLEPYPARRDNKICSIFGCSNEAEKERNLILSLIEIKKMMSFIPGFKLDHPLRLCCKLCKTCEDKFLKGANIVYCKNCHSIVQLFHFKIMRFRKSGIYLCPKCRYCEGNIHNENWAKQISNIY